MAGFQVGIDIGGTFTDLVLIGDDGTFATHKVLSTPADYSEAILTGLRDLLTQTGVTPDAIGKAAHATTVATNAVLERRGALTGLITTLGFRDVLELRRMRFPEPTNTFWRKPAPLVRRYLRAEVRERVDGQGNVITPLDLDDARRVIRELLAEGITSLAVCLLNSYVNGVHERQIGDLVRAEFPDLAVSLSVEVLPEIKEYERTSTTVVNAYVMPVTRAYLTMLQARLRDLGIPVSLTVMQSNGGMMSADTARRFPVHLLESGPAAGVVGSMHLARESGWPSALTFDMGGTTAKAALIENGQPFRSSEYEVGAPISIASRLLKGGGYLLRVPAIDVAEVGAGGGSLVWIDEGGALHVGPRSAGAEPGPVCYGRGGTEPTITDANVLLGYLNPSFLLGGALPVAYPAAREALQPVADRLGLSIEETAFGVFQVANATMMRAIRAVSIERGRDVRDLVLIAFGGNGSVHAAEIARSLGVRDVVVPPSSGVFSATGLLFADVEHHQVRTLVGQSIDQAGPLLQAAYTQLESEARGILLDEGWPSDQVALQRSADLRYRGQSLELRLPVPAGDLGPEARSTIVEAFHREHERTYGHSQREARVDAVNLRVVARAVTDRPSFRGLVPVNGAGTGRSGPAAQGSAPATRPAYFGPTFGLRETPLRQREDLAGGRQPGPLIIEEYDTTIVVPPECWAWTDDSGLVHIEVKG